MEKLNNPLARGVSYRLIWLTAVQPALAGGITASQPVTQVQQGKVPVVNIAVPNAAGISHNQYVDFNVGKPGAVLNNATTAGQSQLVGAIEANPNLEGKAAQLIINEVTGSSRSALQGQLEVFGSRAGVMIANPNGISCDGCGVINSAALTLTTGKPQIDAQGMLHALEVRKGTVTIGPDGLNGSDQDYIEIISRATELNGKMTARNLSLTQGANRIDYELGKVEPIAGEGSAPQLAVDTKTLGGMYANQIRLLGTEQGVGVNLSHLTSDRQSIVLDANGQLQLADINAKTDLNVSGREVIVVAGSRLHADNDITLGVDSLNNRGSIVAAKDMRLFSDRVSNVGHDARLEAGKNLWLQKDARGAKASRVDNRSATIKTGSGDLVIRTEALNNMRDRLVVGTEAAANDTLGMFLYDNAFNVNRYGNVTKRQEYKEGMKRLAEWWGLGAQNKTIMHILQDAWVNDESMRSFTLSDDSPGIIASGQHLYASASTLINDASELTAHGNMFLTGTRLNVLSYQDGTKKDFIHFARDFESAKKYQPNFPIMFASFIKSDQRSSSVELGKMTFSRLAADGDVVADFSDSINTSQILPFKVTAPTEITVASRPDTLSARNLLLHAGSITSNDNMKASGDMTLIADDSIINQRAGLTAGGNLSLTAVNNIENIQGTLRGENVELLSRQGSILSSTSNNPRFFSTDRRQIFSAINAGTLAFSAGKDIALNDTELSVQRSISANSGGNLSISNSEQLLAPSNFINIWLTPAAIEHFNQALLIPGRAAVSEEISLTAGGDMALNGVTLLAGKDITLSAGNSVSLAPRSLSEQIRQQDLWMTKLSLTNDNYFPSVRTPELRASLKSGSNLQIHAGADINAQGAQLTSGENTTLYAGRDLSLGALAYSIIDVLNDNNKDDRQLVAAIQAGKN